MTPFDVQTDYAVGSWDCVNIVLWRRAITAQSLAAMRDNTRELKVGFDSIVTLTMAPPGIGLPDAPARQMAADLMVEVSQDVRCSVSVIEGRSLWTVGARRAISLIQRLSRDVIPLVVCGSIDDATRWMAPQAGQPTIWAEALRDGVTEFRRQYMPQSVAGPQSQFALRPSLQTP